MALRVLLADESPTIKKAIQLALQDYAVDVRSVNIGVDVLNITKAFQPDIIFSDVLLQKMNGYDVANQLKQDPETQKVPIVLMWSGFLSLDEAKFAASGADAKIEKPFDISSLRTLVKNLVPRTQAHTLSNYLNFPNMPEMEALANNSPQTDLPVEPVTNFDPPSAVEIPLASIEDSQPAIEMPAPTPEADAIPMSPPFSLDPVEVPTELGASASSAPASPATPHSQPSQPSEWDMDNFESIEEFAQTEANDFETQAPSKEFYENETDEDSPWVQQDIGQLSIDPENFADVSSQVTNLSELVSESIDPNTSQSTQADLQVEAVPAPEENTLPEESLTEEIAEESFIGFERAAAQAPSKDDIENYIENIIGKSIEQIIREMVPRIAKEVIQEEIKKLTEQED